MNSLDEIFPDAKCELIYHNNFELLIAVILSAQTTDQKVNKVTKTLFKKYPDAFSLACADYKDVENIIRPLGLFHNKTKNIIETSKSLVYLYNGNVINDRKGLESLKGVGHKTANIILNNCFNVPTFAVDTHVSRVAKRLGIAKYDDDVKKVEKKLMAFFPQHSWGKLHHQFVLFGRYKCKAIKPDCLNCPFINFCDRVS